MNENLIFMANVEHYEVCFRRKRLQKTCLYCLYFDDEMRKIDKIYS